MARKKELGTGIITETDRYLYGEGTHYKIYEKLGAHPKTYRRKEGMYFAVWAPHAQAVSVVGDFNDWNPDATPMEALASSGIYEVFVPGLGTGQLYKYAITTASGKVLFKADPYAEIYEQIWNEEAIGADNTVAVHIRHIREKIEINPREPRYLKVVWGVGYKIEKQ